MTAPPGDHVTGKVIIVTGAGSGFGRLICQQAAARGARLTCVDIDGDAASATATSITEAGGAAISVVADVTDPGAMRAAATQTTEAFGRIDVLVNNAGVMPLALFADHERALDAWHRSIDINIKGVLNGIAAVHDQMIDQGEGHVVNLSSIAGNFPTYGSGVYGATKSAVNFISESLRVEARGAIKVTIVKPTGVTGTGLSDTVVNRSATAGMLGQNVAAFSELRQATADGSVDPAALDAESIRYASLGPEHIARAVLHAIDQPAGVSVGDITIRAAGDFFVL